MERGSKSENLVVYAGTTEIKVISRTTVLSLQKTKERLI
jgi:hypothetical protein